jgi:regulator of RNase E activity RraA
MSDSKVEELKKIESGSITDSMGRLGLEGWMDYILPLSPKDRVVGRAYTIKYAPKRNNKDNRAKGENLYSIFLKAKPGDVIVIAAEGTDRWMFGENTVNAAVNAGVSGFIVDGRIRDITEIRKIGLPMFTRGAAIRPHASILELVDYDVPVECGGAQVKPGDYIMGDEDGVVVVPADRVDEVIYQAKDLMALEAEQDAVIRRKGTMEELNAVLQKKKQFKK